MAKDRETSDGESFASSVKEFASDVAVLIRQDLNNARSEMTEKAKDAGVGAGMLSGSAIALLFVLACLTGLVIVLLLSVVAPWIAFLIVTVIWATAAAALGLMGKRKISSVGSPLPEKTLHDIRRQASR